MEKADQDKITSIILRMVIDTMKEGATVEQAKQHVFNKWYKEYPEILNVWVNSF
jgi:hypothetical protein